MKNIKLKLAALLLAVVAWYAIRETISFEVTISDVPIEAHTPDGWAILHQSRNRVAVTFRGSQEDIRMLDYRQIRAVLQLKSEMGAGARTVIVRPEHIRGIRGVRAIAVDPDRIRFELDREVEKTVPVKARLVGKPLFGRVETALCDPAVVRLRGPAGQVALTELLQTEPLDVEGRVESFARSVRIMAPSENWSARLEPAEVQVQITIAAELETRVWPNVPVLAVMRPDSRMVVRVTPAWVAVTARGRSEILAELEPPKVLVDCTGLDPALTYDLPVYPFFPNANEVVAEADPPYVHLAPGPP